MNGLNGIKKIAFALLKGISFFLAGVVIFSAVFYFFTIPEEYIPILRAALIFITAFLTGVWSGKGATSKGWLRGIVAGILLSVLFIIGSKIWGVPSSLKSMATYAIIIAISLLGGIVGINVK